MNTLGGALGTIPYVICRLMCWGAARKGMGREFVAVQRKTVWKNDPAR